MLKLLHNDIHLSGKQSNAQNSPIQASTVRELWTSRCSSWILKKQRNQRSNCQHLLDHQKNKSSRKTSTFALLTTPKPLTVWITTNWKILKEMGIPDQLTCLLRNLYAGQEATVRTGHRKIDQFQTGKGVHQACVSLACLLNLYEISSCEMPGWMNQKLESRFPGERAITSDMQLTPPWCQKAKRN